MQRRDDIKEMKDLYSMVPFERKKLLKDFFVNINKKNIYHKNTRPNNPENIYKDCSLTKNLNDWDNLNEFIISYLMAKPTNNILIMQCILSYNPN